MVVMDVDDSLVSRLDMIKHYIDMIDKMNVSW